MVGQRSSRIYGIECTCGCNVDGPSSCARDSIIHDITLVGKDNRTFSMRDLNDTWIEITNSSLEPSQNYAVYVRTRLVHGTCETQEPAATVVCRSSNDRFPTTVPPGTHSCTITLLEKLY